MNNFSLSAIIQILFLLLAILPNVYSQSANRFLRQATSSPITYTVGDTVKIISLLSGDKRIKPDARHFYFWYAGNRLKSTQGDFAGKLLDGDYLVFNSSKDLLTKGRFKQGIKSGKWMYWYEDGKLSKIEYWRNGVRSGKFLFFERNGNLKSTGTYKNGQLHGRMRVYTEGVEKIINFRNGKLVERSAKPAKWTIRFWKWEEKQAKTQGNGQEIKKNQLTD